LGSTAVGDERVPLEVESAAPLAAGLAEFPVGKRRINRSWPGFDEASFAA
jgi:hypothetical protein